MKNFTLLCLAMFFALVSTSQEEFGKKNFSNFFNQEILNNSDLNPEQLSIKKKYIKANKIRKASLVGLGLSTVAMGVGYYKFANNFSLGDDPIKDRKANQGMQILLTGALSGLISGLSFLNKTVSKNKIMENYYFDNIPKTKPETIGFKLKMDSNKLSFTYQF